MCSMAETPIALPPQKPPCAALGASGTITTVAADVTTPEGRDALLAAAPAPDILVNNAAGPPPGDFREWSQEDWMKALNANLYSPVALIEATIDGMIERRFGRIINITSAAVKAPIPHLGLSNAARTGLTGFVAGLARQVAAHNVTINNSAPRSARHRAVGAKLCRISPKTAVNPLKRRGTLARPGIPAKRFGTAEEFGHACAFFCSARAGYITGQNLVLDGGGYPGTL